MKIKHGYKSVPGRFQLLDTFNVRNIQSGRKILFSCFLLIYDWIARGGGVSE